ncbi:MAG: hypothetical protein EBS05_25960, partial [Proteobacteria bacterium]|nr:hypothetical protein [Pseudomonadota bacterium]
IAIHSEDRDVTKWPTATQFEVDLPVDYKNVVGTRKLTAATLADMLGRLRRKPSKKTAELLLTLGHKRATQWVSAKLATPIVCPTFSFIDLVSKAGRDTSADFMSLKVSEIAYLKKYPGYHYRLYVDEDHEIYARPGPQQDILRCLRSIMEP